MRRSVLVEVVGKVVQQDTAGQRAQVEQRQHAKGQRVAPPGRQIDGQHHTEPQEDEPVQPLHFKFARLTEVQLEGQKVRPNRGGAVAPQQAADNEPAHGARQGKDQAPQRAQHQAHDEVGARPQI